MAVEWSMLPSPARGEQTPPARKPRKPRTAEALPECRRTGSRARAVVVGIMRPRQARRRKRAASTRRTWASATRSAAARRLMAKNPRTGAAGAPGTAEARHEEAAGHDSEGVEAEAEAVEHGRQAVALLEDEGGGGDVGEHDAHGEGLNEGVAQELAVARDGKVRLEGGEEAWTAFARGGASGLAEAEEHEEKEDAEGEKDGEYAPPVGERQEEATEDGSEDGGEALHDAEHGEVAGKAVALVEVDGDGAGDDDSARPGDALEEAVGEEEADVGGEKARGGGDEKEEEGGHEGRFAAEAVAERADEELPEAESHHAEGEAELDGGDGGGEVFAELRQDREVEVRDEGAERGKQSGEP